MPKENSSVLQKLSLNQCVFVYIPELIISRLYDVKMERKPPNEKEAQSPRYVLRKVQHLAMLRMWRNT